MSARVLTALLVLAACDAPAPIDPGWSGGPSLEEAFAGVSAQAPPPSYDLALSMSELIPGQSTTWTVTGLNPGETATILIGFSGVGDGPCSSLVGGLCADVETPLQALGQVTGNASGVGTYTRNVPGRANTGRELAFQAMAIRGAGGATSVKSNPLLETVIDGVPGLSSRPSNPTCVAPERPPSNATIAAQTAWNNLGLNVPVKMLEPPHSDARWYVVEQGGRLKFFNNQPSTSALTALDISGRVVSGGELGFLSVAFHPDFPNTPELYAYYTSGSFSNPTSRISRFTSPNGLTFDANSEEILISVSQPASNHNGGDLHFGPDGYLYFGFGDGGSANDPWNNAQNTNNLLGTMIRIDVDSGTPYAIPADNPFASGVGGAPEVWAWGLRNPYRWSFDSATGTAWVGDVGQNAREEISIVEGGKNYGWKVMEGTFCANPTGGLPGCGDPAYTPPVYEYPHSGSQSVIGGFVYRGSEIPGLVETYLFAEFYTGQVRGLTPDGVGGYTHSVLTTLSGVQISSFAQANDGEIYLLSYAGTIYKLVDNSPSPSTFPGRLSETGCFEPTDPTQPLPGLIPYTPRNRLWSDGLTKRRWLAVPDGTTIDLAADGDFEFPIGTVLAKEFTHAGQKVETRLFMRHPDGDWGAYTYRWNQQQTDAVLVTTGAQIGLGGGLTWTVPSQSQCFECHTSAAGYSLGLELAQLNSPAGYDGVWANQIETLDHIGLFTASPGAPSTLPALARMEGPLADVDKARSYLHSNCSMCHRPGAPNPTGMDLRYDVDLAAMNICDVALSTAIPGNPTAVRFRPGDVGETAIHARMDTSNATFRMPPLGTELTDDEALSAIQGWILDTTACP